MENLHHFDEDSGICIGRTSFSPHLLCSAILAAASRVEGVAKLKPDFGFLLRHLFRGGNRGVVVRPVGYNSVVIDICLVAQSGYTSAELSYRVQEAVLAVAQNKSLTDKRIKRVDVKIVGVEAAVDAESGGYACHTRPKEVE